MTATSTVDTGDDERRPEPVADEVHGFGLPFAWEHGPHGRGPGARDRLFRFPAADDAGPGQRRLLVMALGTALIGLLALAVTIRGVLVIMGGTAPGWYQPVFAVTGAAGFACVVGAFLSVHRRRLPWLLLGLSVLPLAANVWATMQAAN
jgi:hypothetical protein